MVVYWYDFAAMMQTKEGHYKNLALEFNRMGFRVEKSAGL